MADKYNYEVGKFYDTAVFIVTRLFKDAMIERIYNLYMDADIEHNMRFFNELENNSIDVPDSIIPACYCNSQQIAFLIKYINDNINFDNDTLDDVISLLSDIEKSKNSFIGLYFPKLTREQRQQLVKTEDIDLINNVIADSEIPISYHSAFSAYLLKYESRTQILIETFKHAFPPVDHLHLKNFEHIQGIIKLLNDPVNNAKVKLMRFFALNVEKQIVYTFSLLNPYIMHYWKKPFNHPFRVGEKIITALSFVDDYRHISFVSFARCIQTPAREQIFDMFMSHDYLNASDIIDETGLAKNTVYAHIDDMLTERLLIYVDIKSHIMHYAINDDYLEKYSEYSRQRHVKRKNLKQKGDLKHYERKRKRRSDAED